MKRQSALEFDAIRHDEFAVDTGDPNRKDAPGMPKPGDPTRGPEDPDPRDPSRGKPDRDDPGRTGDPDA